jgi:Domain of unknown function (DUF4396)
VNILRAICFVTISILMACSSCDSDWKTADTQSSIAAYQKFLADHPDDPHAEQARSRVQALQDEQAWAPATLGHPEAPRGLHLSKPWAYGALPRRSSNNHELYAVSVRLSHRRPGMNYADFPRWLHELATTSLIFAFACAGVIVVDEFRRPQKMWIMNLVWPLTTLFGSVIWLVAYYLWGAPPGRAQSDRKQHFLVMVAKGTSHCGAGCTLGDIIAEWAAFGYPAFAVWFGWHRFFGEKTFAVWIPEFILAWLVGIAFQYFTIKPMRNLSTAQGLIAALKADSASISAWQLGMYGLMALIQFGWFRPAYGGTAPVPSPEFWFAMQIAMLAGFITSYPVNWWLLRNGLKEQM